MAFATTCATQLRDWPPTCSIPTLERGPGDGPALEQLIPIPAPDATTGRDPIETPVIFLMTGVFIFPEGRVGWRLAPPELNALLGELDNRRPIDTEDHRTCHHHTNEDRVRKIRSHDRIAVDGIL